LSWPADILPKSFNLHITHQKSSRQTLFLYSEKHNNLQKLIGQKLRRGQKFRLTPEPEICVPVPIPWYQLD